MFDVIKSDGADLRAEVSLPATQSDIGETRGGELGVLLRGWRSARGKSQLELALEAGVSQRHLSFIESGRKVPGREKPVDIGGALDVPLRERNALLLAAGYAPIYHEGGWDEPQ